jgi:sugar fermentation stimulation protein A
VQLPSDLEPARIVRRLARFTVEVELRKKLVSVHLANSGRVEELLTHGSAALVAPAGGPLRRTHYDLVLVRAGDAWVSADARLPNLLVQEALAERRIPALDSYTEVRREVRAGDCRIDFRLNGPLGNCLLEVKSVTLVEGSVALFPDAKTARAVRQLSVLAEARQRGDAACVLFVVQRGDAEALRPNDGLDPAFGAALRAAAAAGVTLLAYRCHVTPCSIELANPVPVLL